LFRRDRVDSAIGAVEITLQYDGHSTLSHVVLVNVVCIRASAL